MMGQYLAIKKQYPDCLVFFRLGDFYELFFEDALIASKALEITLTRRGQNAGEDIPMCGVPFHAYENYMARLVRQGHRVAICEQMESPQEAKKRGYKAVVKREVVRVITPGTITEDTLLNGAANNYLVLLWPIPKTDAQWIMAVADISTGEFFIHQAENNEVDDLLSIYNPSEIIVPQHIQKHPLYQRLWKEYRQGVTELPISRFDEKNAHDRLCKYYEVTTLQPFGIDNPAMIIAAGSLLDYIQVTQLGQTPRLHPPEHKRIQDYMEIDAATRKNLELTQSAEGASQGSLFAHLNLTQTALGQRLLYQWINAPLIQAQDIEQRLDSVAWFVDNPSLRSQTRKFLQHFPDVERILSRISLGRSGPRDLQMLGVALKTQDQLFHFLQSFSHIPVVFNDFLEELIDFQALQKTLEGALKEDLPILVRDGGFIAPGYDKELDECVSKRDHGQELIQNLQERYRASTNINSLKIKHNNVLGYFIEVPASQASRLNPQTFIHRQTLANNMRFNTQELSEMQNTLMNAAYEALQRELFLFEQLCEQIRPHLQELGFMAKVIAHVDVWSALGELACTQGYARPAISDDVCLEILEGRHPIVEKALREHEESAFTPNSLSLHSEEYIWLMTGPNMAGKSTFLRQNALIIIMAQMGSYVPAQKARIGVVDRLFSRIGAGDNLAKGHSTFYVEMLETASILNQATEKSFVILDEVGRGTSANDGLAIAWAVIEYIHHHNRCRTLFATHYHELVALQKQLPKMSCYTMKIQEWNDKILFLHQVIPGAADKSYGVHVAKLAGLPATVVQRAQIILQNFEKKHPLSFSQHSLPLFEIVPTHQQENNKPPHETFTTEFLEELKHINPEELSPRKALDMLYTWKEKIKD